MGKSLQEPSREAGGPLSETAAQTQTVGMNRGGPNGEALEVELTGLREGLRWGGRGEATSRLVPSFFVGCEGVEGPLTLRSEDSHKDSLRHSPRSEGLLASGLPWGRRSSL